VDLPLPLVLGFALVLTRTASLLGVAPILGSHTVPMRVRAALIGVLSMVTFLAAGAPRVPVPADFVGLGALVASELALGLAAGLSSKVLIDAAQAGGQVAANAMGFGFGMMLNPHSNSESSTLGELFMALALGAALVFHLPEECIAWLVRSVREVPPGGTIDVPGLASAMTQQLIFGVTLSVRVAFPLFAAAILGYAALGALGRTAPQLSLQNLGFAVSIASGVLAVFFIAPDAARMCADAATRIFTRS
jgi:flagellar biosynthetic protein FliR